MLPGRHAHTRNAETSEDEISLGHTTILCYTSNTNVYYSIVHYTALKYSIFCCVIFYVLLYHIISQYIRLSKVILDVFAKVSEA